MVHGRSIRARVTIATVVSFGILIMSGVTVISLAYPRWARAALVEQADEASRRITTIVDTHRFTGRIPPQAGVGLLQVVDDEGRVVAASAGLAGQPPITSARPSGGDSRVSDRVCRPEGCMVVVGTSNRATVYGPIVAYAAVREPFLLDATFMPAVLYGSAAPCWR